MNNILVTGGAGFIGSNFILHMLNEHSNINITNFDKLTYASNQKYLSSVETNSRYQFVKGDICSKDAVLNVIDKYYIDTIVNFAAESHVDNSIANPSIFGETNIMGVLNLLQCSQKIWDNELSDKLFLQISTDEVYGSLGDTGYFTEKSNLSPNNPYAASKASADLLGMSWYNTYKFPIRITRCSNNYGKHQHSEKLIPLIIKKAVKKESIPIYGDGLNVRDWIHVMDHVSAIDMVLQKGKNGEVYNIGSHNEYTNITITKQIIDWLNKNYDIFISDDLITFVEDRKGHDRRYAIDNTKIKNEIGWQPQMLFNDGLIDTVKWYIDNYSIS